ALPKLPAEEVERAAIVDEVEREIAAGRPGTALLIGHKLWDGHKALAFEVLDRAYEALDRPALRTVAATHRAHPALPSLDLLKYKRGDYADVTEALANPSDVRELEHHRLAALPDGVGELVELEVLQLGGGQLTTLPATLARCAKLRKINLYNNRLTQLPAVILELTGLRELVLGKNQLTAIDGIAALRELESLDLAQNPIVRLPDDFVALTKLTSLNLAGTKLQALPERFCELDQLEFLALQGTAITQLPADVARLHKLKRLALPKLPAEEVERVRAALPATTIA
ncbi:MAG TPA: leucine-rich repeat domain-containing protein, partial [Kofleriaceae bacterium]|nr:leucine-rich repeat domain-containing protein [Kofleriaceae bacterium]